MLFLVVFQTVVLSRITVFGASLDLPVAFACLAAFMFGQREGFWLGVFAGVSADVFSPERFVLAMAVPLTCFLLGLLKERFFSEEETTMFAFVFGGTFFSYLSASWILTGLYAKDMSWTWPVIIVVSVLNALFTPYLKALIIRAESINDGKLKI